MDVGCDPDQPPANNSMQRTALRAAADAGRYSQRETAGSSGDGETVKTEVVHATQHMTEHYRPFLDGFRAVQLIDDAGSLRGELVWRLATGHTVEITEMGIFEGSDRRRGHGSALLTAALQDMESYFDSMGRKLRLIYLFCEARNEEARAFYEVRGFQLQATLHSFYDDGDATIYAMCPSGNGESA